MFFEMFGACVLANILTTRNQTSQTDYTGHFNSLHNDINRIGDKIDKIIDTQQFMKARSCLENFSPNLLNSINLTYKHHSIQDIMEAAKEGFAILCKTACADENNFLEARKIFEETYGNPEWVDKKYGKEIDKITEEIARRERIYGKLYTDIVEKRESIKCKLKNFITDIPCKKVLCFTVLNKKEIQKKRNEIMHDIKNLPYCSTEFYEYCKEVHNNEIDLSIPTILSEIIKQANNGFREHRKKNNFENDFVEIKEFFNKFECKLWEFSRVFLSDKSDILFDDLKIIHDYLSSKNIRF